MRGAIDGLGIAPIREGAAGAKLLAGLLPIAWRGAPEIAPAARRGKWAEWAADIVPQTLKDIDESGDATRDVRAQRDPENRPAHHTRRTP
jgi:hypothetical protein